MASFVSSTFVSHMESSGAVWVIRKWPTRNTSLPSGRFPSSRAGRDVRKPGRRCCGSLPTTTPTPPGSSYPWWPTGCWPAPDWYLNAKPKKHILIAAFNWFQKAHLKCPHLPPVNPLRPHPYLNCTMRRRWFWCTVTQGGCKTTWRTPAARKRQWMRSSVCQFWATWPLRLPKRLTLWISATGSFQRLKRSSSARWPLFSRLPLDSHAPPKSVAGWPGQSPRCLPSRRDEGCSAPGESKTFHDGTLFKERQGYPWFWHLG